MFFEVSSQTLDTGAAEKSAALMIYRDRTKAKKVQDRLLQREKQASIGLLTVGIAHEINNPLAGVMIFSQTLLKQIPEDLEFYQDVVEIEAAAPAFKSIVAELLNSARKDLAQLIWCQVFFY